MMEERCECGFPIPRGYGYYNLDRDLICINCGKKNKRDHPETPEEFHKKLNGLFTKSKQDGEKKE